MLKFGFVGNKCERDTLVAQGKTQSKKDAHKSTTDVADESADRTILDLQAQLKELDKARQDNERKAAEYFDKLQRLQADMENLQKVTKRQIETVTNQASADLTAKLLPILDALRQASNFARGNDVLPPEEIAVGLDMLYKQLLDVLRTVGLEEITAVGQLLDPEKHEVVSYVEREDAPENTVVEEIRKGYQLNAKVIRAAMVIVARSKASSNEGEKAEDAK